MNIRQGFLVLTCLFIISSSDAQEPLVFIEPINPNAADIIRIGVRVNRCDIMPYENSQGLTHLLNINNTNIELNAIALIPVLPGGIICFPPNPIAYYELGVLNEGDYSLSTWIYGQFTTFPFPPNFDPPPPYEFVNFSVTAAPIIITSSSYIGLLIVFILLLTFGINRIKRNPI